MAISMTELLKATRLTRAGRLSDATQLIQRALGFGSTRAAPRAKTPAYDEPASVAQNPSDVAFLDIKAPPQTQAFKTPAVLEPRAPSKPAPATGEFAAKLGAERNAGPRQASFTAHQFNFGGETYAYRLFTPSLANAAQTGRIPLVVMLHGCKQDAADFARGTAMNELAEAEKCMVLYPEQLAKANSMRCWNWFETAHQKRGSGEPTMIATLTRHVLAHALVDPARVYIAGLSAGGAMAAVVARLYPDVFAAVGVHSGLPPGAANDLVSAFSAMRRGARPDTGAAAGNVVPTIVFHGKADSTVHPDNGDQIIDAAVAALGANGLTLQKHEPADDSSAAIRSSRRTVYRSADGKPYIEHWSVAAGPHAWSGGDASGSFTDPTGPDASRAMLDFFLQHTRPS